jgi:hypothetical protein
VVPGAVGVRPGRAPDLVAGEGVAEAVPPVGQALTQRRRGVRIAVPVGHEPDLCAVGATAVVVPCTTRGVAAPGRRARPRVRLATRTASRSTRAGSHRRELLPRPTVAGLDERLAGGRSDISEL